MEHHRACTGETPENPMGDPLDEDDHRDRVTASGRTLRRHGWKHWHSEEGSGFRCSHQPCVGVLTLSGWGSWDGPLTFAPEAAQETPRADPSAPQDESGAVGGGGAPTPYMRRLSVAPEGANTGDAQEAILCPECDDHINTHNMEGCRRHRCDCPRTPEDVARALIAQAAPVDMGMEHKGQP